MKDPRLKYFVLLLLISACSAPKPLFESGSYSYVAMDEIEFTNMSERAESYLWDFGDGNTSIEFEPTHRYRRSGEYIVTLAATTGEKTKETTTTMEITPPSSCLIELSTQFGSMLIQLFDDTPLHRDNFLKLAEEGFYDDLLFHRVMSGFMVQGGDPDSREALPGSRLGVGGPGYQIPAEFDVSHVHVKGALAAARQPDSVNPELKSSGSQFYIVQGRPVAEPELEMYEVRNGIEYSPDQKQQYLEHGGTPQLDMAYTVFGRVIEGIDVVDKIAAVRTNGQNRPNEDVRMKVLVIK